MPFYFQGYRILSILLSGIWDTRFNIIVTSRDIENLRKLIMVIFADLKGIFASLLQGIWDIWPPPIKPLISSEAKGKQVKLFEKKKSQYFLASSQSIMLSSPLPFNEIQPNLVCELYT